jgi:hypothetical protein
MVDTDQEIVWHNDGHVMHLQLTKANLEIVAVDCPKKSDSACAHDDTPCVVKWFLDTYGLECNVGVTSPSAEMTIAWSFIGDRHKDLGACQVWVIPTNDEAFSAWMVTQS